MPAAPRFAQITLIAVVAAASVFATVGDADARRAGGGMSFGSRGTRTYTAPPATTTAPTTAAPIERSMTPQTAPQYAPQPGVNAPRTGGMFGGFGRSILGGLAIGGLFGMLMGTGFGGGAGFLGMLLQIALIGGAIMLAMRFFANRQPQGASGPAARNAYAGPSPMTPSFRIPTMGGGSGNAAPKPAAKPSDEIGLSPTDYSRFEALLTKVQTAYGAEDYGTIRAVTTPEAMSYLAEELGENATNGVRNSVSQVKLLQGDVSEAWRENGADFATMAMRYSSIDAMVDRTTGKLVDGDDRNPSESTELWTFTRKTGGEWILSAIQGTQDTRH